jgi:hypothetical protein
VKVAALLLCALLPIASFAGDCLTYATNVASLIEPAKLATLGKRGANQRVQKYVVILENARLDGCKVAIVASNAVALAGYTNALLAELTREVLTRNHGYALRIGVLNSEGLAEMKRGNAATIKRGTYEGQELSVDHVIPFAVVPELDNVIANLELMPQKRNQSKGDKIGSRERTLAMDFRKAGLITQSRLDEVLHK